ncbi:MAG: [FeFe] hydrogenase H-cluster radical SAM maturase HydE [bacterium]|nr:[FeFe] hydrogenase H-cluster radical SAM maturase HydE [bacterium]
MCLTIPAKIKEIDGKEALVQVEDMFKKVNISLISDIKIGDWILYISNIAVKVIPQDEAEEILELLQLPSSKIDIEKLDKEFRDIIEASKTRELKKEEIVYLLNIEGQEKEALFSEANIVRKTTLKDFICIHGIIEFSNYCKNDCSYCGLRVKNTKLHRYRMSVDEIVETAHYAVDEKGYKLLVLQSGEDFFYTDDMLAEIIKRIKEKYKVFIFISVGERGYECYKKMKDAGASGVLFRFETSNPKLFKTIHPSGKDLKNRFEHLKFMGELGYYIATGSIIGLPGQTIEDLADDILVMKEKANMVSMGPFVPCDDTPFSEENAGDTEMNLKMIAILRLMLPTARIPVVTALETLVGKDGRQRSLQAGANSLMINLTPAKYRPYYKIYPDKFYQEESVWEKYGLFKYEESYKMIEDRMADEINKK